MLSGMEIHINLQRAKSVNIEALIIFILLLLTYIEKTI